MDFGVVYTYVAPRQPNQRLHVSEHGSRHPLSHAPPPPAPLLLLQPRATAATLMKHSMATFLRSPNSASTGGCSSPSSNQRHAGSLRSVVLLGRLAHRARRPVREHFNDCSTMSASRMESVRRTTLSPALRASPWMTRIGRCGHQCWTPRGVAPTAAATVLAGVAAAARCPTAASCALTRATTTSCACYRRPWACSPSPSPPMPSSPGRLLPSTQRRYNMSLLHYVPPAEVKPASPPFAATLYPVAPSLSRTPSCHHQYRSRSSLSPLRWHLPTPDAPEVRRGVDPPPPSLSLFPSLSPLSSAAGERRHCRPDQP
jgi:hypothetical protein